MVEKDSEAKIGTLTVVIGIFIIYLEPFMMTIDILASLVNQASLIDVFDRLHDIDNKLESENILLNYNTIKRYSIIFITITFVGESTLGLINLIIFNDNSTIWQGLWWLVSCVPLFVNGISKTWFLVLILMIKQRLIAINSHFNDIMNTFSERKLRHVNIATTVASGRGMLNVDLKIRKDNLFVDTFGYLEKEIYAKRNVLKNTVVGGNGNNNIHGWSWANNRIIGDGKRASKKKIVQVAPANTKGKKNSV
jgi:hypothetical protein